MINDKKNKIGWRIIVVDVLQLLVVQQVTSKRIAPATMDCSLQFFAHAFDTNVIPGN
jgi:hypothetical protein